MNDYLNDMKTKGLVRVQSFDLFLKTMCEAEARQKYKFGGQVKVMIFATELYELNAAEKEFYGIDRRN